MEEHIKEVRTEFLEILKRKKITFYEWERMRDYINEKYECTKTKSTL